MLRDRHRSILEFVAKPLVNADTRMGERHYGHIARQALLASSENRIAKLGRFEPAVEPKLVMIKQGHREHVPGCLPTLYVALEVFYT